MFLTLVHGTLVNLSTKYVRAMESIYRYLSFDEVSPPSVLHIFRGDGEKGLERRVRKPRDGKRFSIVSRVVVPRQRASHGYSINHGTAVL